MTAIFLCAPLSVPPLVSRLAGQDEVAYTPATLPDHGLVASHGLPLCAPLAGETAEGVVVHRPPAALCDAIERLCAAGEGVLRSATALVEGQPTEVRVISALETGSLRDWLTEDNSIVGEMLAEILRPDLSADHLARARRGLLRRAIGRSNARTDAPEQTLGTAIGVPRLSDLSLTRRHGGFFVTEGLRFSHRLIGGGWSAEIDREVFVTGDAVSVLPWDPATGQLLLIRQIRAGMVARGDPDPWNIEAIAGLVDRAEDGPQTARREAEEEAGLPLGPVAPLAEYYTSPGTMTEYIRSYVALCDLSNYQPGIHGLEAENEDIETLLVTEAEAAAALDRGEVRNAPLMISLLAFFRKREELMAAWGLPLAGGEGHT